MPFVPFSIFVKFAMKSAMIKIQNACSAFAKSDPLSFLCEFFRKDFKVDLWMEFDCHSYVYVVVNFQDF